MTTDKLFKTYRQQMRHLRDDKKILCNGSADKELLCRYGYFNLINGYKMPFVANTINGEHFYIANTSISHFLYLKEFDDSLRQLLFKNIVLAEEEVRTFAGYKFDQINEKGMIPWYNVEAYDSSQPTQNIVGLISKAYSEVGKSKLDYVQFYMTHHKFIPTWILVKVINFSTFIDFVEYGKPAIRDSLCELYGIKTSTGANDHSLLISSLHWLRKTRNSCAHNERIYCSSRRNGRCNNIYLDLLPFSYHHERTQKILDLLLYLKFYLSSKDYKSLITSLKKLLIKLQSQIPEPAFNKVRADLGIKNISHLDILLSNPKDVAYNKFESYEI